MKHIYWMLTLLLFVSTLFVGDVSAEIGQSSRADTDCVIPESGPWPPCATGGSTPSAGDDCVIPESGPWPSCATGGGTAPTAPPASGGDCVIPESGPWPPCATGGGAVPAMPPANGGDCVIPDSGPWPPCATGGGSAPAMPAPAPAPVPDNSAEKTRRYTLGEIRSIFIRISEDSDLSPDDCSIDIVDASVVRISCELNPCAPPALPVCFVEMYLSFAAANGVPLVTIESLVIAGNEADKNDDSFKELQADFQARFVEELSADLNYSEVLSITLEANAMVVVYR